ncbi:Arc family DNA-binding protein [Ancylobacter dichloromethanicus]|uniref:Arc-like DNA binding domain-containing protein n=1 Tax=Ancylobacter dichloromethanicus TaxID=518825 RepID=A0A9W6J6I5_9HYPH|nr:Arc family DNA-binding protein [Ancylobacter dichloromethanicus]MBS7554155.1 Arc family DNA-binding protein [Ancylobacter dichloromethanicus]GLK71272.1 hypothetical protein GCM10017643_13870 [Ancylobacter dichloromethanicus]
MTKAPAPSDLADKVMLRLPTGMRDRLAAAARETGRSMNAEIVSRLEKSLDQFKTLEELVETVGTVNELWTMVEALQAKVDRHADILRDLGGRVGPEPHDD